jgi:integrase
MTFDHAGIAPNPARDRIIVRLPRNTNDEVDPPTAADLVLMFRRPPRKHQRAFLWLELSGARVGAIDKTLVSDYDEINRRIRLRASTMKIGKAQWVELPDVFADAIEASLPPHGRRDLTARLFADSGADALRAAMGKACAKAGVRRVKPHDLRHRRISLLHAAGYSWAEIGARVAQRDIATTANTYRHVIADRTELDYAELLAV